MPAITARFTADVSDFRSKLQQLTTDVTGFDRTQKQVASELRKFGNDFSGATAIRQFEGMSKAVEDLGGVSRLTASEVNRLASTAAEVQAKYQALGETAPAAIQKITTELKQAQQANEAAAKAAKNLEDAEKRAAAVGQDTLAGLKSIGAGLAGAFTAGAVLSFGKGVVDTVSQVHDLAEATGLGVEAVQEYKYAFTQTGSSLEAATKGIGRLSKGIEEGSATTRSAISGLGLSIDDLRKQDPDQMFTAVANAIGNVQNPAERSRIAIELFGKSGAELLPAMVEGFSKLRQEAHEAGVVIDQETVNAIESMGDVWDRTVLQMQGSAAKAAVDLAGGVKSTLSDVEQLVELFGKLVIPPPVVDFLNARHIVTVAMKFVNDPENPINPAFIGQLAAGALPGGQLIGGLIEQQQRGQANAPLAGPKVPAAPNLAQAFSSPEMLAADARAAQDFAIKLELLDLRAKALADRLVAVGPPVANFVKQQQDAIAVATELAKRVEALGGVTKLTKDQQVELNKVMSEAVAIEKIRGDSSSGLAKEFEKLATASKQPIQPTKDLRTVINELVYQPLPDLSKRTQEVENGLRGLTADGLIPVTKTFTDLAGKTDVVANKGMPGVAFSIEKVKVQAVDLVDPLDGISRALDQLSAQHPLNGLLADLARATELAVEGARVGQAFSAAFYNPKKTVTGYDAQGKAIYQGGLDFSAFSGSKGGAAAANAYLNATQIALQGYSTLDAATNIQGRGSRALSGAEAGAAIGATPALATATYGISIGVGAAVGALIGALRNPGFEQEMKRVATTFGTFITEDMGKALDALAENQFHGDRQAAEEYSFGDILQQAGGLKASNVDVFTKRLRDVFSEVDTGKFSVEQAQDVLEKSFTVFADDVTKSKDLASKAFQDIITLNHSMGVDAASVRQFVTKQAQSLGADLAALAGPLEQQYGGITDKIAAIKEQLGGLSGKDDLGVEDSQAQADLTKQLNDLLAQQAQGAATAGDEMARLGVIALASFNAAVAGGEDVVSALADIGPGLDELIGLQKDLGIETDNAALSQLEHFRDLVNQNQTLVLSASALGDGLKALTSIGGLTTDALAAMEQQGGQTFDRLVAAGFTENEALQQMKGFLLNVLQAHKQLGTPIDENTQRLLDMAEAQGLLEDDNPTDVLKQGFKDVTKAINDLVHALGYDIPNAATDAGQAIRDRLPSHVPIDVDFHYNVPDLPDLDTRGGGQAPPTATGGIVWSPQTRLVGEAGPELISPLRDLPSLLGPPRDSDRPIVVQSDIYLDGAPLTRVVQRQWSRQLRASGAAR